MLTIHVSHVCLPVLSMELILCKVAVNSGLWLLAEQNGKWQYYYCPLTEQIGLSTCITIKNLKIRTQEKIAIIILTVEQFGFMTE